jgi:hypothetical protein
MPDAQVWDDEFAKAMVGKTLLVGLTYADPKGDRLVQVHGKVLTVDARRGIELRLAGEREGDVFWLSPDLRGVAQAPPGSYRLRTTGETVENPDFTATWIIHPSKSPDEHA